MFFIDSYRWLRGSVGVVTNNTGVLILTNVQVSAIIRVTATNFASGPSGVLMTPSAGVALTMLSDFDGDGMADAWEVPYGLDTNNIADATLDFDGDGMSNRDEYLSGTDPTNSGSVMKLTFATTNAALLEWRSAAVQEVMTELKPDGELLRDYVERRSESAFGDLVERHTNLVFAASRALLALERPG